MAGLMTTLGTIFTTVIGWVGTVASTITAEGNEILLLFAMIPLIGLGVGLFKRLLNVQ